MGKRFAGLFVLAAVLGAQTQPDALELAKQAQCCFGADLLTKECPHFSLKARCRSIPTHPALRAT